MDEQKRKYKAKQIPKEKLYVVEERDVVYVSRNKLDAIYKHVEYKYGQAKYKEVDSDKFFTTKRLIRLDH